MALLIKAEELKGLISIPEAVAAVRDGFSDQGEKPTYSAPRIRIQHEDRRVSVHPGGCHRLQVAGTFIHVERFTFRAAPSSMSAPASESMSPITVKPRN
jgi:hypothetical protein